MHQDRDRARSSVATAPALSVLIDLSLLQLITQFQRGIPLLLHDLVGVFHARYPNADLLSIGLYWASALRCGDLAAVQLLCRMRQHCSELAHDPKMKLIPDLPSQAAIWQRLDVLQWLHDAAIELTQWHGVMLLNAVLSKRIRIARWLMANRPIDACENITRCLAATASAGNLPLFNELLAFQPTALTPHVMDKALQAGAWDVIHYLHEHAARIGCTTNGMDWAADHGRLDVVTFLHHNRTEGCTTKAMDAAACHGHYELLTFLHNNRTEGCTTRAMDDAAWNGHLAIVEFLHHNRTEGCSVSAMDRAAARGHLDVVQFLYQHRTEGCTEKAMRDAADNGHLDVVRYLHETCGVVVRKWRMAERLKTSDLAMVQYIHEVIGLPMDTLCVEIASEAGNHEVVEYVKSRVLLQ